MDSWLPLKQLHVGNVVGSSTALRGLETESPSPLGEKSV